MRQVPPQAQMVQTVSGQTGGSSWVPQPQPVGEPGVTPQSVPGTSFNIVLFLRMFLQKLEVFYTIIIS